MMTEGFFISVAGQEFPSWCGQWKRPPRCCSARWDRDAMIIYSPSVGSAFEKCWCWEKMALRCLKGKPQGGQMLWYSSRGIAAGPRGCSLPSRGKFAWVTPTQLSRRNREMAGNEQRRAPRVTLLHIPMKARGEIWSETVLIYRVSASLCSKQYFSGPYKTKIKSSVSQEEADSVRFK